MKLTLLLWTHQYRFHLTTKYHPLFNAYNHQVISSRWFLYLQMTLYKGTFFLKGMSHEIYMSALSSISV
jgi:hypothetical protein